MQLIITTLLLLSVAYIGYEISSLIQTTEIVIACITFLVSLGYLHISNLLILKNIVLTLEKTTRFIYRLVKGKDD